MHYAISKKNGETVVTVRSHVKDITEKKVGTIIWGRNAGPREARFLLDPHFLAILPVAEPPWKERIKQIAAALVLQHWEQARLKQSSRLPYFLPAASGGRTRQDLSGLTAEIAGWIDELLQEEIPPNQLEKTREDIIAAFQALRNAGGHEYEQYCLAMACS